MNLASIQPSSIESHALVLASASARRAELLGRITSGFIIVPSDLEEWTNGLPEEQVVSLAKAKALAVAGAYRGVIIGADTVVVVDEHVLGKPQSRAEARSMLMQLSGKEHRVLTGLCVLSIDHNDAHVACEETKVMFRSLSEQEIGSYLDTGEYWDKAGGYAIQGRGAAFVSGIHGDYFNVMGLPICRLVLLLREVGVDLLA